MVMPRSRTETLETGPASDSQVEAFERDGFAFPLLAFEAADIDRLRRRTETELLPLWGDPTQETDYTFQTHLLFPLILAVGVGRGRRFQDFLRFVRDALCDEWNRPR